MILPLVEPSILLANLLAQANHRLACAKNKKGVINMSKRMISIFFLFAFFLSGCQASPIENIITSKNDGSFDISIIQSETHPNTTSDPSLNSNYII